MSDLVSFKFDKSTGERFREFVPKIAASQSDALSKLLDFYLKAKMAPNEKKNGLQTLISHIDKRSNGIVAIIKNIEKDKIDRMHGMMIMLFGLGNAQEKLSNQSTDKSIAKNDPFDPQYKDVFDKIELNHRKKTLEWEVKEVKQAFHNFLDKKITLVRPRIGKPYLKVQLELDELKLLKQQYKTE